MKLIQHLLCFDWLGSAVQSFHVLILKYSFPEGVRAKFVFEFDSKST